MLLEIDPAYADVIGRRWQEAVGRAAVLEALRARIEEPAATSAT